ncbi:MAG: phosphotransferase [Ruminococcus sp.]|nr:phosphotransferase [Ruminococcus sp.]
MDFSTANHKLTIYLKGSLDSAHSDRIEKSVREICDDNIGLPLVFDMYRVDYISTEGIRTLLRFRNSEDEKINVINVSNNLYELFMAGGSGDMFEIRRKPRTLSLKGLKLEASSDSIKLYRVDEYFWLKVNLKKNTIDDIDNENIIARSAFINGIPTEIAYEIVYTEEGCGQLYELSDAHMLAAALYLNPDKISYYTRVFAGFMKDVHCTEMEGADLPDAKRELQYALEKSKKYFSEEDYNMMYDLLATIPDKNTFLYGDFDTEGIMLKYGSPFFVDFANVRVGHPVFDLADIYITYCMNEEDTSMLTLNGSWYDGTGFSDDMRESLFRTFISEYFPCSEEIRHKRVEFIRGIAYLKLILAPAVDNETVTEEMMKPHRRFARMYLMNDVYDLIGKLDF